MVFVISKTGDFNICNFEAISDDDNAYLKQRKPYVLHASEEETARALKRIYSFSHTC